jgi:hypothetical protein
MGNSFSDIFFLQLFASLIGNLVLNRPQPESDIRKVHIRRRAVVQALVQALVVVEVEIAMQACFQRRHHVIVHEIEMLVLDRAPQPFDKDIVQGSASTIHADSDLGPFQDIGEFRRRELGTLISIEDLRLALLQHGG